MRSWRLPRGTATAAEAASPGAHRQDQDPPRVRPPSRDQPPPVHSRNVFSVKINYANQLLIEGKPLPLEKLRQQAKEFILNPAKRHDLADSPSVAVILLQNDRSTNYHTYLSVYNELKGAYNELWEEAAQNRHGMPFDRLSRNQQKAIRERIPLVTSENDVVEFEAGSCLVRRLTGGSGQSGCSLAVI